VVEYLIAEGTSDDVIWPMVKEKLDVLNKAGLSKDNFHEVDATSFTVPSTSDTNVRKTKPINEYFSQQPQKAIENSMKMTTEEDSAELDDELLLQLMDESF
jgi:hypothetical protein